MNNAMNDQSALSSVNICLYNTLHMLDKSLPCFAKIWKIDNSKNRQNLACNSLNVQPQSGVSRSVLTDSNNLGLKIQVVLYLN